MKEASLNVLMGSFLATSVFYLSYFATYFYKIIPFTDIIIFRPSVFFAIVISYLLSKSFKLDTKTAVSSFFLFLLACLFSDLLLNLYDFIFKESCLLFSEKLEFLASFIVKTGVLYKVVYTGIKLYLGRINKNELLIKCFVLAGIFFIYKFIQSLTVSSYYTQQIDEVVLWLLAGFGLSHEMSVVNEDCYKQDKKCISINILFKIIIIITLSFLLHFGVATSRIRPEVSYVREITIPNKLGFYIDDLLLPDLKNEVVKVLKSEEWEKRDGGFSETGSGRDSRIEVSVLRKDTKRFLNQKKMNELSDINQAEFKLRYETDFNKLYTEDIRSKTNLNVVGKDFVIEITEVSMPNTEGELIQMFCGDLVKAVSKK